MKMSVDVIALIKTDFETKSRKFEEEIKELRQMIMDGRIDTDRAHKRIDELEKSLEELKAEIGEISRTVSTFSPKLDKFMDNLWKLVFALLVIVAGLVGIKLF